MIFAHHVQQSSLLVEQNRGNVWAGFSSVIAWTELFTRRMFLQLSLFLLMLRASKANTKSRIRSLAFQSPPFELSKSLQGICKEALKEYITRIFTCEFFGTQSRRLATCSQSTYQTETVTMTSSTKQSLNGLVDSSANLSANLCRYRLRIFASVSSLIDGFR